jgi:hypothetical protein
LRLATWSADRYVQRGLIRVRGNRKIDLKGAGNRNVKHHYTDRLLTRQPGCLSGGCILFAIATGAEGTAGQPDMSLDLPARGLSVGDNSIQLRLREISQLFNSLDPSPFTEQDLDRDAEEFIVSWARELPRRRPLHLILHLERTLPAGRDAAGVAEAVRHYFSYRESISRLELRQLFKQGRTSLLIGGAFLTACLLLSRLIGSRDAAAGWSVAREGLTIAGWVAMWRPMEIYLYDWWPLQRRVVLLRRLSQLKIDLRLPKEAPPPKGGSDSHSGSPAGASTRGNA